MIRPKNFRPGDVDLVPRLGQLDTCAVSDAADVLGLDTVVASLGPVWEGARVSGRAVTVQLLPGRSPPEAGRSVHLGARAIEACRPGDVIVVANEGRMAMGGWGGLLSLAASQAGVAGVVLDGACRDVDEARVLRFPVFARAAVPRTARGRAYEASCGEPVTVDGVPISTGDLVVADGSGVIVVPAATASELIMEAERITGREDEMAARLSAGESAAEVLGGGYEALLEAPQRERSDGV